MPNVLEKIEDAQAKLSVGLKELESLDQELHSERRRFWDIVGLPPMDWWHDTITKRRKLERRLTQYELESPVAVFLAGAAAFMASMMLLAVNAVLASIIWLAVPIVFFSVYMWLRKPRGMGNKP